MMMGRLESVSLGTKRRHKRWAGLISVELSLPLLDFLHHRIFSIMQN